MVDLVDLAPARKTIQLRGQPVEFRMLSVAYITAKLREMPALSLILAQKAVTGDMVVSMIADLPDLVAQIIATGTGKQDDAATVGFILTELSPGEWLTCLETIVELSFPQTVKSFVEALSQGARSVGIVVPGWEEGTKSEEPSSESSPQGTFPRPLGDTAQSNSTPGTKSPSESASQEIAS